MTSLHWDGLAELQAQLRNLPANLRTDAGAIINGIAHEAQEAIQAAYPVGPTGNLRKRVTLTAVDGGTYGAAVVLKSAAPHAWLYEHGSNARQTKQGWKRGKMPKNPVFGRTMARKRREMWKQIAGMMREAGLVVTENYG